MSAAQAPEVSPDELALQTRAGWLNYLDANKDKRAVAALLEHFDSLPKRRRDREMTSAWRRWKFARELGLAMGVGDREDPGRSKPGYPKMLEDEEYLALTRRLEALNDSHERHAEKVGWTALAGGDMTPEEVSYKASREAKIERIEKEIKRRLAIVKRRFDVEDEPEVAPAGWKGIYPGHWVGTAAGLRKYLDAALQFRPMLPIPHGVVCQLTTDPDSDPDPEYLNEAISNAHCILRLLKLPGRRSLDGSGHPYSDYRKAAAYVDGLILFLDEHVANSNGGVYATAADVGEQPNQGGTLDHGTEADKVGPAEETTNRQPAVPSLVTIAQVEVEIERLPNEHRKNTVREIVAWHRRGSRIPTHELKRAAGGNAHNTAKDLAANDSFFRNVIDPPGVGGRGSGFGLKNILSETS